MYYAYDPSNLSEVNFNAKLIVVTEKSGTFAGDSCNRKEFWYQRVLQLAIVRKYDKDYVWVSFLQMMSLFLSLIIHN